MVAKWNNLPAPKKGKPKLRSVLKRLAASKTKDWERVPYVRGSEASPLLRHDRCKWKRSLTEILTASPASLVAMLREDGLLHSWEGSTCPHCQEGTLGKLMAGGLKHRCSSRKCHKFVNPHQDQNHPLFVNHWGSSSTPLATQAALLLLLLNRIPHAAVHRLLHINHKTIEDMSKRLCQLRESWVVKAEKKIRFGTGVKWYRCGRGNLWQKDGKGTTILGIMVWDNSARKAWYTCAAPPQTSSLKIASAWAWSRSQGWMGSDVCADPQAQGSWQPDVYKGKIRHPNHRPLLALSKG